MLIATNPRDLNSQNDTHTLCIQRILDSRRNFQNTQTPSENAFTSSMTQTTSSRSIRVNLNLSHIRYLPNYLNSPNFFFKSSLNIKQFKNRKMSHII